MEALSINCCNCFESVSFSANDAILFDSFTTEKPSTRQIYFDLLVKFIENPIRWSSHLLKMYRRVQTITAHTLEIQIKVRILQCFGKGNAITAIIANIHLLFSETYFDLNLKQEYLHMNTECRCRGWILRLRLLLF